VAAALTLTGVSRKKKTLTGVVVWMIKFNRVLESCLLFTWVL
jgi:hypothetical protein